MSEQNNADNNLHDEQTKPIINCHTHIFTGDYVPPLLAKGFLLPPIYFVVNVKWLIGIARFLNSRTKESTGRQTDSEAISNSHNERLKIRQIGHTLKTMYAFHPTIAFLWRTLELSISVLVIGLLLQWFGVDTDKRVLDNIRFSGSLNSMLSKTMQIIALTPELVGFPKSFWIRIPFVVLAFGLVKSVRLNSLLILRLFKKIPNNLSIELMLKYWQLAEYAKYNTQSKIFMRLRYQYPKGTQFVVLPMDMKYMMAGKIKKVPAEHKTFIELKKVDTDPYLLQLEKLRDIKENGNLIHPFIFVDPRRISESFEASPNQPFFDYVIEDAKVCLKDCTIHEYLENANRRIRFAGLKIYPALGYYPFDIELLPLWAYAADNRIPIMTHCVKGTIFYRGYKKPEWSRHPLFEYWGKPYKAGEKLLLSATKSKHYQTNFTHPLNYLCLLNPALLKRLIDIYAAHLKQKIGSSTAYQKSKYKFQLRTLEELFGLNPNELKRDLTKLKICFGHFGGDDEQQEYLVSDRQDQSRALVAHPRYGINLCHTIDEGKFSWKNVHTAWTSTDWYSIICSLILQYPNVYADISYILHNPQIYPLLKSTLNHLRDTEKLPSNFNENTFPTHSIKERILYGTDFYMVRSHKSEKQLLAEAQMNLTAPEFDLIARINPQEYLQSQLYSA